MKIKTLFISILFASTYSLSLAEDKKSESKLLSKNISFTLQKYLLFPLEQKSEWGQMRIIYFQGLQTYTNFDYVEKEKDWCSIRVKLNQKTSVIVEEKTIFKPIDYSIHKNNEKFAIHNFNFVDLTKVGRQRYDEKYVPYSINCSIGADKKLAEDLFHKITNNYFKIGH